VVDLGARAAAVRTLAALLRTGLTIREALLRWSQQAPNELRPPLETLRRRVILGQELAGAVTELEEALGPDAASVATVLAVHARLGGNAAGMLDRLARGMQQRRVGLEGARAAGAGAALSARLVAGLPLAFAPLAPLAKAPLLDVVGLALMGVGVGLGVLGLLWMARLVPRPPDSDDAAALVAELAAAALDEGASVPQAFDLIGRHAPTALATHLGRARRLCSLGATWTEALGRSGEPGLEDIAETLSWSQRSGLPVARALEHLAAQRRAELLIAFDRRVKRGPVLMILPLVTCVLPSFLFLGLAPFLRALSAG
jgi:Flp pilus assembly protein TadB